MCALSDSCDNQCLGSSLSTVLQVDEFIPRNSVTYWHFTHQSCIFASHHDRIIVLNKPQVNQGYPWLAGIFEVD
jgi:hypothetical protein